MVFRVVGDDFGPALYLVSLLLLYETEGFGAPYRVDLYFLHRQTVCDMSLISSAIN